MQMTLEIVYGHQPDHQIYKRQKGLLCDHNWVQMGPQLAPHLLKFTVFCLQLSCNCLLNSQARHSLGGSDFCDSVPDKLGG